MISRYITIKPTLPLMFPVKLVAQPHKAPACETKAGRIHRSMRKERHSTRSRPSAVGIARHSTAATLPTSSNTFHQAWRGLEAHPKHTELASPASWLQTIEVPAVTEVCWFWWQPVPKHPTLLTSLWQPDSAESFWVFSSPPRKGGQSPQSSHGQPTVLFI